jgi:hypothetical protein
MRHLAAFLPDVAIATSADYGIDVDAKEAIAFAVLAHERRAVVLGKSTLEAWYATRLTSAFGHKAGIRSTHTLEFGA